MRTRTPSIVVGAALTRNASTKPDSAKVIPDTVGMCCPIIRELSDSGLAAVLEYDNLRRWSGL